MREIGPVIALLHVSHPPQDILRVKDFERQHHCQEPPDLRDRKSWCFFFQPALQMPQKEMGEHTREPCANAATGLDGVSSTVVRLVRCSPLEVYVCVVVARGWSQPRVSAGVATQATVPPHTSQAAQKSGLLP